MDQPTEDNTAYLPAGRTSAATLAAQSAYFALPSTHRAMLDAVPTALVVLNEQRQIVYANAQFRHLSRYDDEGQLLGARVGDALSCVHADEGAGCGTNEFCTTCGAAHALATAARRRRRVEECHIVSRLEGATLPLDLRVWATPFTLDDNHFTIFAIADIGDEKRREVLERVFFHDLLNTAGSIRGLAELLKLRLDGDDQQNARLLSVLYQAANRLLDEIEAQRQILAAEMGELIVSPITFDALTFLRELVDFYTVHPVTDGCRLRIDSATAPLTLHNDQALLGRIVGNMLKNALEASSDGETVTVGYRCQDQQVHFWVHNPAVMPRKVQMQIFHRSFSTKSEGRGLGTYSMQLLCERYLGGRVRFTSSAERGTIFVATLPLQQPHGQSAPSA